MKHNVNGNDGAPCDGRADCWARRGAGLAEEARRIRALRELVLRMGVSYALGTAEAARPRSSGLLLRVDTDAEQREPRVLAALHLSELGLAAIRRLPPASGGALEISWKTGDLPSLYRAAGIPRRCLPDRRS